MIRRYELGVRVDLPVESEGPARPADVVPTVRWSDDRTHLLIDVRPYDPAAEKPPAEVRIYAIPELSDLFGGEADAIVADESLSYSLVDVPEDPAGFADFPVMLPTYPKGVRHVGQVVYAYDDPE